MIELIEAPEAQSTDITTLPPADRAALALKSTQTEADLKQLATGLKAITLVNSPAGRDQAHSLAMTARGARTAIEKAGKAARDDATKFSKAVIAEEDRLIELIQPEEKRVLGLRDAWDQAEAARKEAELQKERDRIEAHQAVITQIKSYPILAANARTSEMMAHLLVKLYEVNITDLEEFYDAAFAARIQADETLWSLINAKKAEEAEVARLKAEQEAEAARLAEQARIQAEHQAALVAQQEQMKAQLEALNRRAAEVEAQAAAIEAKNQEAYKPAESVVTPAEITSLAEDPREALAQIVPAEMLAQLVPKMLLQTTPAPAEKADDNSGQEAPPSARSMVAATAETYGVTPAEALTWLALRANEFKTLFFSESKI